MAKEVSKRALNVFEQVKQTDENGNEFWSARDLSKVLGYLEYRNFKPLIEKAKEACKTSNQIIENHFEDYLEMVKIGSGTERGFNDGVKLSRHACYLIVQNTDPSKEVIALGQTYFAARMTILTHLQIK